MKRFLLTGATSNLGGALAHALIKNHPNLSIMLTGRSHTKLLKLQHALKELAQVEILPLDLLIEENRNHLIKWIQNNAPDLVINNAGVGLYGDALMHPIQEQIDILELNARATLELSLNAAEALRKHHKKGIILNISSATDCIAYPTLSVYAASKACVTSFSKSLDQEMIPYGIRILVSSPGPIATDFRKNASKGYCATQELGALSPEQAAKEILWQIKTKTPYHVFPQSTRIGRALMRSLLPSTTLYGILRKFLKGYYPTRDAIQR